MIKLFWTLAFLYAFDAFALKVLTYKSMLGSGSLGEFIEKNFEAENPGIDVEFVAMKDLRGLLGELRKKSNAFDLVLGLDERHQRTARNEGLIKEYRVFEESPVVVLANTKKIERSSLPKSWKEFASQKRKLLLQDPRFSNTGVAWLRALYEFSLMDPSKSTSVVKRTYPSWSSSYEAFSKGEAPFVWTYLSSEAYHLCNGQDHMKALDLAEGYPVQREYVAILAGKESAGSRAFLKHVLSRKVQEEIPLRNWMFPASKSVNLPECYGGVTKVKRLDARVGAEELFSEWIDQWSLL